MNRRNIFATLTLSLLASSAPFALAQDREGPITIVVPFPAGGPSDFMARVLGEAVTKDSGKVVIVDNKPGGVAQIAANAVKQSPAGSLNLMLGDWGALGSNKALYKSLSYDPLTDFEPITTFMSFPIVLVVNAKSPANTVKELVAQVSVKGSTYASQGNGTAGHILGAMFKKQFNLDIEHVPYKGSGPAMQDLLGGQVGLLFEALPAALQGVKSGQLKALAVMSQQRNGLLPDVPTATEAGMAGMDMDVWFGIVARKGLPKERIASLNKMFVDALKSPAVATRFQALGYRMMPKSPDEFASFMKSESVRWSEVIRINQISAE